LKRTNLPSAEFFSALSFTCPACPARPVKFHKNSEADLTGVAPANGSGLNSLKKTAQRI